MRHRGLRSPSGSSHGSLAVRGPSPHLPHDSPRRFLSWPMSARRGPAPRPSPITTVIGILADLSWIVTSKSCRVIRTMSRSGTICRFVSRADHPGAGGQITDTFERGDPIQLVMTVRNELETAAVIEFPTALPVGFRHRRGRHGDRCLAMVGRSGVCPGAQRTVVHAEETKTFTQTWNQQAGPACRSAPELTRRAGYWCSATSIGLLPRNSRVRIWNASGSPTEG